jgi:ubiquinone/menaquinone biosynthesis C-methylase UbiE
LIEPDDTSELANAINALLCDRHLRSTLAQNARGSVIKKFNWDSVAHFFEDLFKKSLDKPRIRRLGQLYRTKYLQKMDMNIVGEKILDIGCHDSEWLSMLNGKVRIGLDLMPGKSNSGVTMIKANGCEIPFPNESFDVIYMLDVIEHIKDDKQLIDEAVRVLKSNGKLIITTPNINIKLFPPFLTNWISRNWGHTLRIGYDPDHLRTFFKHQEEVKVLPLNALWYRNLYIPLRVLFEIFPSLTEKILDFFVHQENKKPYGEKGFLLLEISKRNKSKS